jgi:WD40 repeat protein
LSRSYLNHLVISSMENDDSYCRLLSSVCFGYLCVMTFVLPCSTRYRHFSFLLYAFGKSLPFYIRSIWDWLPGCKLSYCSNRASKASRITSLQFVNGHDVSLLLVGSDDGTVRLWNNYTLAQQGHEPGLVTAWHALADVSPVSRSLNGTVLMLGSLKLYLCMCM